MKVLVFNGTFIDLMFRMGLRAAYPALQYWASLSGRPRAGAAVAVWHDGELLVVRHSYVAGSFLPGGGARRGESLLQAALRELQEEVGIIPDRARVRLFSRIDKPKWRFHLFEYRPTKRPIIAIDNREITEARFLAPDAISDPSRALSTYLDTLANAK